MLTGEYHSAIVVPLGWTGNRVRTFLIPWNEQEDYLMMILARILMFRLVDFVGKSGFLFKKRIHMLQNFTIL